MMTRSNHQTSNYDRDSFSSTPWICNSFPWLQLRAGDLFLALQMILSRGREIVIFTARLADGSPVPERLQLPG